MTKYTTVFLRASDRVSAVTLDATPHYTDTDCVSVVDDDSQLVFQVRADNAAVALALSDALRAAALKYLPREEPVELAAATEA